MKKLENIFCNKYCIKVVVIFIFCGVLQKVAAQKISAAINRDKILIGEQVILKLQANDIDLTNYSIKQWFIIADTFNHFEIAQRMMIDTINVGNNTDFIQTIQLTSFDSGYWQIPSFAIELLDKSGKLFTTATQPLFVTVLPVDVAALKDYHDIKDIEEVELVNDWSIIIAIIITALISFFGLLWVMSKKQKFTAPKSDIPSDVLSYQWALQQIDILLEKQLPQKLAYKLFYTELVGICKNFSDAELSITTKAKTNDEYMLQLKGRIGIETIQTQYFQFLRLANAVKFAKYTTSQQQIDESVLAAQNFITTLYQYQNKP